MREQLINLYSYHHFDFNRFVDKYNEKFQDDGINFENITENQLRNYCNEMSSNFLFCQYRLDFQQDLIIFFQLAHDELLKRANESQKLKP